MNPEDQPATSHRQQNRLRLRRRKHKVKCTYLGLLAVGACLAALAFDAPKIADIGKKNAVVVVERKTDQERRLNPREKNPLYVPDLFIRKKHKRNQGGNSKFVFLHAFGIVYMFLALMIVCDNFFGPSLDCMVEKWDIDDDVAGATFMAAGGSAPELATSYMGQFVSKSDIGFGTIVGSAVFNVLFVIACCALVVPGGCVQLTWWPLFRDCSCYIVGLVVLAVFVNANNDMNWYEASLLFLGYIGYVTIMRYNARIEAWFTALFHADDRGKVCPGSTDITNNPVVETSDDDKIPEKSGGNDDEAAAGESSSETKDSSSSAPAPNTERQKVEDTAAEAEWEDPWEWPKDSLIEQAVFVATAPIKFCLYNTLPDCSRPEKSHLFKVTFAGSLVWLALCAYCMVVWTTIVGATLGICDYIMGLTVLAAGTSIPDALSSMYMAKEGRGDMAISSSIGSNVFDILVGLPLPVLTKYFFVSILRKGSGEWRFDTDGILWDTLTLLFMVCAVVTSVSYLNWQLNLKLGRIMFFLYFCFLVSSIARNWRSCTGKAD